MWALIISSGVLCSHYRYHFDIKLDILLERLDALEMKLNIFQNKATFFHMTLETLRDKKNNFLLMKKFV